MQLINNHSVINLQFKSLLIIVHNSLMIYQVKLRYKRTSLIKTSYTIIYVNFTLDSKSVTSVTV